MKYRKNSVKFILSVIIVIKKELPPTKQLLFVYKNGLENIMQLQIY
ncbi:hypothetical protein SAMN05421780_102146 [Flexibacter flexilis DSM 6793]|uniref:Uncharacterized protein n=1 Tax=Flexibacter flexilis DSM 6793 TaxID=927664 RepID=A0A1I1FDT0_9BACT|nr:hypothetical protein SAMN05421780_102146 [Flexibacter flexilis DSM 6793]